MRALLEGYQYLLPSSNLVIAADVVLNRKKVNHGINNNANNAERHFALEGASGSESPLDYFDQSAHSRNSPPPYTVVLLSLILNSTNLPLNDIQNLMVY